jgi:GT2 family glycosyltransferase
MSAYSYRHSIPEEILALSRERDQLRKRGKYDRADALKHQIEEAGYAIKDNPHGAHLVILPAVEIDGHVYRMARQVPSQLNMTDLCTFSVNILTQDDANATQRCIESVLRFADDTELEIILVDNASEDGIDLWAEAFRQREPRLHFLHTTRRTGNAEARNLGLKQSRGRYILMLDSHTEVTGDIFTPLAETLANNKVGVTGYRGMTTDDLRHFEESAEAQVDTISGPCIAFRRSLLTQVGLFDEQYRSPYYMDIDFNYTARDAGLEVVVTPDLPLRQHPHETEASLSEVERAEQQRLNKRNFYRFLEKWGSRDDLLSDIDEDEDEEDEDEEDDEGEEDDAE